MAKPYPQEFRHGVVRVARQRDPGVTLEQIAADFGIHPMTLSAWLRKAAEDEDTARSGPSDDLVEANRRIKLLEQGNEVLRRAAAYLSQANLDPKGSSRS